MAQHHRPFTLGARLAACAELVREGAKAADVGTDHARLPIWLVLTGKAVSVMATDINELPLASAQSNIEHYCAGDKVTTVLCDGLSGVSPNDADDIIIAGMGGDVITHILTEAPWLKDSAKRLILQPMSRASLVRDWLYRSGFSFDEQAVLDGGRLYTVICACYSGECLEPTPEQSYGGALLVKEDDLSRRYIRRAAKAMREISFGLHHNGDEEAARQMVDAAGRMEERAK
ncbi:MAG: SAM-dependent methyltransferase [Ruminococcaceae bacterium]|nr:SAM-dependent methyltransferase [Oscillospiraceae bacterium]